MKETTGSQRYCPLHHTGACSISSPMDTPRLRRMSLQQQGTPGLGTPHPSPGGTWTSPTPQRRACSQSCIPVFPPGSRCWVIPTSRSVQRVVVASRGSHLCAPWGRTGPAPSFPCHIHGCRWGGLWPLGLGFAFKPHPLHSAELSGGEKWAFTVRQELLVGGRFLN